MRHSVPAALLTLAMVAGCSQPAPSATPAATPAAESQPSVLGKGPVGALVTLEPSEPSPLPEGPAVLDQYGKQFVPTTLFVRVGQPVEFRNSEDISHNVQVRRAGSGASVFNVSTDPGSKYVHTFDRAGRYDVSCDLHSGMFSALVATTSPYFAVTDDTGAFSIANVPAGAYTMVVSADGQETRRPLQVAGRTQVDATRR